VGRLGSVGLWLGFVSRLGLFVEYYVHALHHHYITWHKIFTVHIRTTIDQLLKQ